MVSEERMVLVFGKEYVSRRLPDIQFGERRVEGLSPSID